MLEEGIDRLGLGRRSPLRWPALRSSSPNSPGEPAGGGADGGFAETLATQVRDAVLVLPQLQGLDRLLRHRAALQQTDIGSGNSPGVTRYWR